MTIGISMILSGIKLSVLVTNVIPDPTNNKAHNRFSNKWSTKQPNTHADKENEKKYVLILKQVCIQFKTFAGGPRDLMNHLHKHLR